MSNIINNSSTYVVAEEQKNAVTKIAKIFNIFKVSKGLIKPHFICTGDTGTGKSFTIKRVVETIGLSFFEINAAQLAKEGASGNTISKSFSTLLYNRNDPQLIVCFIDEFDKLFVAGNSNSQLTNENTIGLQNEFLKILESKEALAYGEYGKYYHTPIDKILFCFAGNFNGESDLDAVKLKKMGVKTEFLGRVNIIVHMNHFELPTLIKILNTYELLDSYCDLFAARNARYNEAQALKGRSNLKEVAPYKIKNAAIEAIVKTLELNKANNFFGARILDYYIHEYFLNNCHLNI